MTIAQNPRAIVTGGASGLGRAFCLALAKRGGRILVADRDVAGAEDTARQVGAAGAFAEAIACDVSQLEDIERLARVAQEKFGGTDLVINNAGVAALGRVGETPIAAWQWLLGVNLWGVVHGCHVFAPRFRAQRSGHILNVASAAGLLCAPEMGPYNVSKAGVIALSETLNAELSGAGVGVTVLCPTFFKTRIMESAHKDAETSIKSLAEERMAASNLKADDVARIALASCDRDELYCVPMMDGRWAWRLKRLLPESYHRQITPRLLRFATARAQGKP
jgi:NAD(P)-dependent dehydrogenase (short-subunit alcohol dehydrogenase family)